MTTQDMINNVTLPERSEVACLNLCAWLMSGSDHRVVRNELGVYTAIEVGEVGFREWQASSLMELVEAMQKP